MANSVVSSVTHRLLPFRPAMIFVNDSQGDRALAAAFQQNALQRVRAGDEAEVLFKGIPGRVFKAKVRLVIDAIGAGQLQTTGTLVNVGGRGCPKTGRWFGLTSSMTRPVTRCRSDRQAKPRLHRAFSRAVVAAKNPSAHAKLAELRLP